MQLLVDRFAHVFFTPGNHDLYVAFVMVYTIEMPPEITLGERGWEGETCRFYDGMTCNDASDVERGVVLWNCWFAHE